MELVILEVTKWLACIGGMPLFGYIQFCENICLITTFQNETVTVSFK